MSTGAHLASEEVAAYLDNTLSDAECARVKAHLADCDSCRQEIVSVSKLLDHAPRSRRRWIAVSSLAAAAAVLTFFVVRPPVGSNSPERVTVRGTQVASEGVSDVRAISPIGRQPNRAAIPFVWHSSRSGTTYRLTLTDDRGGKVWVGSTNDTTLALPAGTALAPDRSYNWYVDALLPNGSSATTGVNTFLVTR